MQQTRVEGYELSPQQKELWRAMQAEPGAEFSVGCEVRVEGTADRARLGRAVAAVLARHEALRTSYAPAAGLSYPLQVVGGDVAGDVSAAVVERGGAAALELAVGAMSGDRQSLRNLVWEIATAYAAPEQPLPPVLQYADLAQWQNDLLASEETRGGREHWRRVDAAAAPDPELALARAAAPGEGPAHLSFGLQAATHARLAEFCRRRGATPKAVLLTAWAALLSRLSSQPHLRLYLITDGRPHEEIASAVGLFARRLPMALQVEGSFVAALAAVSEQAEAAERWQEYYEAGPVAADGFGFGFEFYERPAPVEAAGLRFTITAEPVRLWWPRLSLSVGWEGEGALTDSYHDRTALELEYDAAAFTAEDAERLGEEYVTLLGSALEESEAPVGELEVVGPREREQLLAVMRGPGRAHASEPVHEAFLKQVRLRPDAVAVVGEDEQLTYAELDRRANQLARFLIGRGVGADRIVGVCMERGVGLVVGLLGILKAGGAYLPLDPAYPQERLAFMLEDAGVSVLLTQAHLRDRLPQSAARVVYLNDEGQFAAESSEAPDVDVSPENLAYIIYTSGSTGWPKGVLVQHANVMRLLHATQAWFSFDERDVWTLFHSYAFDFSVWEIWGALCYGGRLVVVPYLVSRSPDAFYQLLAHERVTVLNQTPSAFRQLVQAEGALAGQAGDEATRQLALRLVIFGGEALAAEQLQPWFDRHGDECPQLVNMYGITETTVHVTYYPLRRADAERRGLGSIIGRPIPDLSVYLLDKRGQPAPVGVPGELHVGGAGVARGYLRRPELNAERFVPDPFGGTPGARLYRSGDLARYLPDGNLEYLGRIDDQVKVRGHRIELGEIEAALRQHEGLREAVVVAREDTPGDKRLVAYVVAEGETPSVGDLRAHLKLLVPDYMTPAHFVVLDKLPLTPNGKVDRKALPAPEGGSAGAGYEQPRGGVEEVLAGIWGEVLRVERVGVHDNFFELGGDSILSIKVMSRAKEAGLEFTLQNIFQNPTISELARVIDESQEDVLGPTPDAARPFSLISEADRARMPESVEDAYPLTSLQQGMMFHTEFTRDSAAYHNIAGYHLRAPLDPEKLDRAVQVIGERHPVLRTSFDLTSNSQPLQLVHRSARIPVNFEDISMLSEDEQEAAIERWMDEEKERKFDWTTPPLLRFQIHVRSEETIQLTLVEHHAIVDGWSVASMFAELFKLYFAMLKGEPDAEWAALNTSYRSYVALEREAAESEVCRAFWTDFLAGSAKTVLPRFPVEQKPEGHAARVQLVLIPAEVSEGIKRVARSASVPIKSLLLAAHLKVLSTLSGELEVMSGLVTNGRLEVADGERVLGLFLNTLPFRLRLGRGSWADLARQTFQVEREMLPYRRYPLPYLQKLQGGEPLYEAAFNFAHFHVYESMVGFKDMQLISAKSYMETNFTLLANFGLNVATTQVQLALEYNSAEISSEQIELIGDYYLRTLEAIAADPYAAHEFHSPISTRETEKLLIELNDTEKDYSLPEDGCVHQIFEASAERFPGTPAVVFNDETMTYAELNRRANQLAHYLRSLGVGPEAPVGICLDRSLDLMVSALGVLKAGGAYVPLDPSYPHSRLIYILEDAKAPIVLTRNQFARDIEISGVKIVCMDSEAENIARESEENPRSGVSPDNLTYIIYTSGSTGKPKGIGLTHRCLANLIEWHYDVHMRKARTLQFASFSFDASFHEMFSAWRSGGTLFLIPEPLRLDIPWLARYLGDEAIEKVTLPVTVLRQLADEYISQDYLPVNLKEIIATGEQMQLSPQIIALANALKETSFHNHYGPSETHVVTAYTLPAATASWPNYVPIGRPITHTQVYVLDPFFNIAPTGVVGDLSLGGLSLARGYVNKPALTAEKFRPNPFSTEPGARMYKTGDLARVLTSGDVEFLGRVDHQVKIRGFRVEIDEVEAVLAQSPLVQEAVVLARKDASGANSLVAYVVARDGELATTQRVREFLGERLPAYTIPSAIVLLDAMPLTPNGKVDRKALLVREPERSRGESEFVAPGTAAQKVVAGIWSQVLGIDRIGVNDNFFELGGHSLLATQIVVRLREIFQVDLPVGVLFEAPTIDSLLIRMAKAWDDPAILEDIAATVIEINQLSAEEVLGLLSAEKV
jgi:amino acid adenylation domain-containing protein